MAEQKVDVAIIGAGTAGLAAYRRVREHTERLLLIEVGPHGTTCARVGCMPSKLLIAAADAAHAVREAPVFGIRAGPPRIDGQAVMARVRDLRDDFVRSVLEVVEDFPPEHRLDGYARFIDDHRLQVGDDAVVEAERILIATGSRPAYPALFGEAGDLLATSDDVFEWPDLPASVAVFGGGIIGLELGQALHRLGVRMRLFGKGGAVGPLSDPEVRDYAARTFAAEFAFDPDAKVGAIRRRDGKVEVTFEDEGGERTERFDLLLAATGRRPNVDRLGLENTGLELDDQGVPLFDRFTGQCGDSHIFIAGDADDEAPLLHEAADEGKIAGANAGRYPDVRAQARRAPLGIVFSRPADRDRRQILARAAGGRRRPRHRRGVVRGSGPQPGDQPEPGPPAPVRRARQRPVPRRRDDRPGGRARRAPARVGGAGGHERARDARDAVLSPGDRGGAAHGAAKPESPAAHGPRAGAALPRLRPRRLTLHHLNRQLRRGPELVPRCLDCGPGA